MASSALRNWSVGEIATRKGRYCEIVKIHHEMDPPSVTVKMLDTDDEVNTEFGKLQKANLEDMPASLQHKMNLLPDEPWQCSACTLINEDPHATKCPLCETPRQFTEPSSPQPPTNLAPPTPESTGGGDSPMYDPTNIEETDEQMEENEWDFMDNPDDELNVVTWNVWFREDIEIEKRIETILSHIEKSDAHLVVLQEVTPLILQLIETSSFYTKGGWKTYGADLAQERGLPYFVVMLSRIPPTNRSAVPQLISMTTNMGRYCIAMDFLWNGQEITLATTHLESREGNSNKYSSLRQSQIATCFEALSEKRHVIFGGDMNWVDSSTGGDGSLSVPREWQDVWLRLRGNEVGATYDEQSNEMILGVAQHRLDRLFVKGDRVVSRAIEMIGKESIAGLTFERPVRSGNFTETRHVPVLASSHYGLFARLVFEQRER